MSRTLNKASVGQLGTALALTLALSLGACTTSGPSSSGAGLIYNAPDKFVLYNCPQLEVRAQGAAARKKVLEQLMAKAGTTPDGRFVSLLAYQSEYTEMKADLEQLRAAAAERKCKPIPALAQTSAR
jgi:hypothetical protein